MPAPARTLDLRTDHGVVRVYRFDGPAAGATPLVLLPGRASASPVWADNLPSLLRVGDVYTVDLLGEPGLSVQERPVEDDADQAAWLAQVLEQLPEESFHLVGLSIGGWTAANLAVHRPERVASLTLVDPVFVFADLSPEAVLRSVPASVRWLPRSWRDRFTSWTAGGAPVEDVPVADMIELGMQHYALALPAPARIEEAAVAGITVPTLLVVAGSSVMHDPEQVAANARRLLPEATVRVYAGASHAVNGEQPERIADDLAEHTARRR
nr:alpha/beta hydrolase [Auraticoccus cholistanensis]